MKSITHIITSEWGIHARPAGCLAKFSSAYACEILIGIPEQMVSAGNILEVMSLDLKKGDNVVLIFNGPDEAKAHTAALDFLRANL